MVLNPDLERLSLALAAARLGDWSWDAATDVVTMSPRAAAIFGIPPGPHMTWTMMRELLHPEDAERARLAVETSLADRTDYVIEYRLINSPHERWVWASGRATYDGHGAPTGMLGVVQDRTRERMLARLEEVIRGLHDPAEIAQTAARMLGQHLQVNRCAYATVDADEDGFLVEGDYTAGVPSIVGRYTFRAFGQSCVDAMRAGKPYVVADARRDDRITPADLDVYERTLIRAVIRVPLLKNGRIVAAMAVHEAVPREWDQDEIELVSQVADRSWESIQRARVERESAASFERERSVRQDAELQRRLLSSLVVQAPNLIAVLRGPDHVIELANPPMCRAWGLAEEDVRGRRLFDIVAEPGRRAYKEALDEVFRTGEPFQAKELEAVFERPTGSADTMYVDLVYSPYRGASGAVEGIFVVANDVTRQVVERQQVDHLRQAAESASRAKDEFMAMLGHELRNPLSPILTALQMMKMRGDVQSERERAVIERQVMHLTRLVDDLLDVSRIAGGKVDLKLEVVEIAEIVTLAIEMASPLLEQRVHSLETEVPRADLPVRGDITRLSQVIANLLTNAAKYTPAGGRIVVRAHREGDTAVLSVRDTGIGIDADVLPNVFDLFVRGRQYGARGPAGLGLGLTIVRSLVERHGGAVVAHSAGVGKGSEFVVRLPMALEVRVAPSGEISLPARRVPLAPSGVSILIVDDNEDGAEMLAHALRASGHEIRVAHDGPAAIRVSETFRPDVALLDLGLPLMDGYELVGRLRLMEGLERTHFIAVTGYGQDWDREKTRAAGFRLHFVKPVDLDEIEEGIAALLHTPS